MHLIRNIFVIVISSLMIYYFRLYSILGGGYFFRTIFKISLIKNNIIRNVQTRVLFEFLIYLVVIMTFYFLFKIVSIYFKIDKIYLLLIVISPFLFEISSILYDQSCFKPWYSLNKFVWYFPICLSLWLFLYWYFKDLIPMLKLKRNLIIVGCVFLIFNCFRIFGKDNFF